MAQIGPDYTYLDPITSAAATRRKITTLARKDPVLALFVESIFGVGSAATTGTAADVNVSANESLKELDKYSRNLVQTLFAQELAIARNTNTTSLNSSTGAPSIVNGEGVEGITDFLDKKSQDINELFKPVSTAIGSTLGTLTGMVKDPLGSVTLLPRTLADVVERVNPQFAAIIEGSYKKLKLENIVHLPSQIVGSISNAIAAVDSLLAIPLAFVSDLYSGLLKLMSQISNLVDKAISIVTDFFFGPGGLLDSILPVTEILSALEAINSFIGEIQGLTGNFLNIPQITNFTNIIQSSTNQIGSVLQNPVGLLVTYLPQDISKNVATFKDPQAFLKQIIPPQISQQFAGLANKTGLGFSGNLGFGFENVLEGLQGGVLTSILGNFSKQVGILTPLLNAKEGSNVVNLAASYPPILQPALAGGQPTSQGIVQPQAIPKEVISTTPLL